MELACGVRPRILESFQWEDPAFSEPLRRQYRQLYGGYGSSFCVLLDLTKTGGALPVEREKLEQLIEDYSVMGADFRLICLEDCCHTDTHCYLGVNSRLSVPETARTGGITLGAHITVG